MHVSDRELRRGPGRLEDVPGPLEVCEREIRAGAFPATAAEDHPEARGIEQLAERLESVEPVGQELLSRGRFAVQPVDAPDPAHDARALGRIGHVRESALEERDGLVKGDGALGFVRTLQADRHRLGEPSGSEQVVSEVDGPRRLLLREHVSRSRVDLLPPRRDHVGGDRLLRQRVPPAVASEPVGMLFDQLLADRGLERRLDCGLLRFRHREQGRVVERPPEHGRCLQHLGVRGLKPRQAEEDRVADRLGDLQLLERFPVPAPVGTEDVAALDCLLQHLLEHEGVAFGALVHEVAELVPDLGGVEDGGDHLGNAPWRQGIELDDLRRPRAAPCLDRRQERVPAVELVAPVADEDECPQRRQPAGEMVEELAGRVVGPVDILDH